MKQKLKTKIFIENGPGASAEADIIIPAYGAEDENGDSENGNGEQIGTAMAVAVQNSADGNGQPAEFGTVSIGAVQTGDCDACLVVLFCLMCGATVMLCVTILFSRRGDSKSVK